MNNKVFFAYWGTWIDFKAAKVAGQRIGPCDVVDADGT
jgi:hypothetical protein